MTGLSCKPRLPAAAAVTLEISLSPLTAIVSGPDVVNVVAAVTPSLLARTMPPVKGLIGVVAMEKSAVPVLNSMVSVTERHPLWALPDGAIARLGQGSVRNMAVSPDGSLLAVSTKIGLWWYELDTMQLVALWETGRGMVSAISFSHDGHWVAVGNDDGIVKVWHLAQGVCIAEMARQTKARQPGISQLAFSPDAQRLAATGVRDDRVDVWHPQTGEHLARFYDTQVDLRGLTRPIAFSTDSCWLACTNSEGIPGTANSISVWDLEAGECIVCLTEPTDFVQSLCFSPCGRYLASGGYQGTVRVWEVKNWQQHRVYAYGASRISVTYSSPENLYATAVSKDTAVVWDVERDEKRYSYFEEHGNLQSAHFSRGPQFVVAGAREWTVWTAANPQPRKFLHSHTAYPDSLGFLPDGRTLAAGSWHDGVKLWDIAAPAQHPICFNLPGKHHAVSVAACGKLHATGVDGTSVKVWEVGETAPRITLTPPKKDREVSAAALSLTGNLLAYGDSKGTLYVWDVRSKEHLYALTAHDGWIDSVALSPDEKCLASIRRDGADSRLWDVESGKEIGEFPDRIDAIAFSPCSEVIACGMAKKILLWDVNRCETFMTLPHAQQSWWPFALAFSPCGRYLASGAWWHRGMGIKKVAIRLWNVASGENIVTFRGHPTDVQCLAFSPDGALLASGSFDGTILLWDVKPYLQQNETS